MHMRYRVVPMRSTSQLLVRDSLPLTSWHLRHPYTSALLHPRTPPLPSSSTCNQLRQMQWRLRARQRICGDILPTLESFYLLYKDMGDKRVCLLLDCPQLKAKRQSFGFNQNETERERTWHCFAHILLTQVNGPTARPAQEENSQHGIDCPL